VQSFCKALSVHEDYGLGHFAGVKNIHDELNLLLGLATIFELLDVVQVQLLLLHFDLLRFRHNRADLLFNLIRVSCAEKNELVGIFTFFLKFFGDKILQGFKVPFVCEEYVGFVNYEATQSRDINRLLAVLKGLF